MGRTNQSLLLALALGLTAVPTTAWAEEPQGDEKPAEQPAEDKDDDKDDDTDKPTRHGARAQWVKGQLGDLCPSTIADLRDGLPDGWKTLTTEQAISKRDDIKAQLKDAQDQGQPKATVEELQSKLANANDYVGQHHDIDARNEAGALIDFRCELTPLAHAWIVADFDKLAEYVFQLRAKASSPAAAEVVGKGAASGIAGIAATLGQSITTRVEKISDEALDLVKKAAKRRLEREAVVALVDRLTDELCGEAGVSDALPRLCSLADDEALNHASSGTDQLRIVQAATRGDLAELPGRVSIKADGFLSNTNNDPYKDARLRFTKGLQAGESGMFLLPDLGDGLIANNADAAKAATQCLLDLVPRAVEYAPELSELEDRDAVAAAFIAAAAKSNACEGKIRGRGGATVKNRILAWKGHSETLERLAPSWRAVLDAEAAYEKSVAAVSAAPSKDEGNKKGDDKPKDTANNTVNVDVDVDVKGDDKADDGKADDGKTDDDKSDDKDKKDPAKAAKEAHNAKARAHAQAAINLTRALVDLGRARARLSREIGGENLGPARKILRGLSKRISLAELVVTEQWAKLLVEAVPKGNSDSEKALRRFSPVLTALASEQDRETLLLAVRAAAVPAASWRTKYRAEGVTVSLGAHVGITSGYEMRFGTYGATRHNGSNAFVSPTLFAPIGIDAAWRTKKSHTVGVFFSAIDPAAFLQYDVHNGGRLPGARLTTALAPGVAFRTSLGSDTPLSLMIYGMVRPQLRTWEATTSGPGATAVQVGAAITWDIPIHIFRSRKRRAKKKKAASTAAAANGN